MALGILSRSAAALIVALAMAGQAHAATGEPARNPVSIQMHLKIPMHDGTRLDATLFRPAGASKPRPVVFMLTPYPDDTSHPSGAYFAEHGLNYVYVDARGRGDSEGTFAAFENDAGDGYDVVEWLAKQPWSNGKIAMFGGSYAGGDQWQVAGRKPPHLVAIAPVASVRYGLDFPMSNNVFTAYMVRWLAYTSGHALHASTFSQNDVWNDEYKAFFLSGQPFTQIDSALGLPSATFQRWVKHPEYDGYWKGLAPSREQVANIKIPMLVITGARDGDQFGTLSFYKDHLNAGGSQPDNYQLVIGPWDHAGTRAPEQDIGDEHFGPASLLNVLRLHLEWYEHVFAGAPKPAFLKDKVAYYVQGAGAECWKYAPSLANISKRSLTLYPSAAGGASSLYQSGLLQANPGGAAGGQWLSDPRDLRRADRKTVPPGDDLHGDGLIFHSEPFDHETEIDGLPQLSLSLAIDGPDADVAYELYLVAPDGKAHDLSDGVMRARYRASLERAELVSPGAINTYDRWPGQWFAVRAPAGARLRLVIRSLNDPGWEKNWNSPKPVAEQTSKDAHSEIIRLVQTADHRSKIVLPLGNPSERCVASADW